LVKKPSTSGATAAEAADQIAAITDFAVEPNYIYELAEEPLFPKQWSLENTGKNGGKVDADIDILAAWTVTTGSSGVIIAVLDTGVAFAHPDMSSSIWQNSDEIAGNGIDDDGNGYIDDVRGWDAVDKDADPSDVHGHGTFVATTAAAPLNGVGMAGVAPDSVVMPIRVCGSNGCPHSAILTGLEYAIDNGAEVINLSLGGYGRSTAMETAIRNATAAGIVVVAAAGNDGVNNDIKPFYPASYDVGGLISVAASNHNDALAWFSNYGAKSVDLVAPGQSVIGGTLSNSWGTGSGTSFAAPKVAGVVALIKAERPSLNPVQVAGVVIGSVDVLSNLSGKVASGGRLNAGSAVAGPPADTKTGDPSDEQFFYRASDGVFLYYDVNSSGKLTSLLRSGKYSAGWSSIMAIDLDGDGKDEQFFYRASDGLFLYYDVNSSGKLTSLLRSGKYSAGWSSIMAINLDG
jgi:subtilisin family serine protease